ncbi:unnamed protein product [Sphagnum troendelagicum]|uniref:Kinesin motor domain-containing protein n=1 Tax=Sphagnum troendelagicum TaxID=128251 RepID=A0ABP0U6I4_9BRYO
MVKGKTNVRLNFLSPKTGTQECEASLHEAAAAMAAAAAAARPPLSALSAGARNILASISNAPSSSTNAQTKDGQKLLLSPEIKSSVARSAGPHATTSHEEEEEEEEKKEKYPHLENSSTISNSNVREHTTPAAGRRTPDPFLTSTAAISKPSTQQRRRASWLPTPPKAAAKNVEAAPRRSSFAGTLRHSAVARALSSSFGGGGGMGEESMTSSTSTSDFSDPESIHSSSLSQATTRSTHKRRATKQHKKSATTTRAAQEFLPGVLIAAAAGEFQKTPSRALKPWRNGPFGTTGAAGAAGATSSSSSPGNIRGMAAGMPRGSGLLQQQQQQLSNLNQNSRDMVFELEEDPCFWNDHNVQVLVRIRPVNSTESGCVENFTKCLNQESAHSVTWLGQPESQRFTFDHVAGEKITQEKLFKVVGLPMVENCLAGYNSCMFAYGQTGSGKTHTMLGDIKDVFHQPSDDRGMTPRIFEYLFARIIKEEQERKLEQLRYVCKCSFLEIHNEQITDLLEPTSSNLQIREDSKTGVYVENLSEVEVKSMQDVVYLLLKGAANRRVAATHMNAESSRSHSVFACTIESRWQQNALINMRFGRLNLVDLAGSERQKISGAEGERLKEAANINKSLSTLGLVIMVLIDVANGKQRHVPYRDSKLTYLLQDSLGGNSKTAIIATVSPSSCCAMETLSTLKFAQRAKFIQNNAVVNEDASGEMIALRREIQRLKEELNSLRSQTLSSMRRERRRESDEFFRLSITPKAIFSPAPEDHLHVEEDEPTLTAEELLEKIKALEAVLAGALRRELVADTNINMLAAEIQQLNTMVQAQEEETEDCRKLVCLCEDKIQRLESLTDEKLSVESYLNDENKMLEEELQIMQRRIECNPKLAQFSIDNLHLAEQLKRYQDFYASGERETLLQENLDLRNQILELLNGKITVEQAPGALLNTEADHHQKELEICQNDLTTCLEASAQIQRQLDEKEILVGQLTLQCTELQNELDLLKKDTEDLSSKYQKIVEEKDNTIGHVHLEWEAAATKLLTELAEGDKVLIEAEKEIEEIVSDAWLLKSLLHSKSQHFPAESKHSLPEADVDEEQEYFGMIHLVEEDEIFSPQLQSSVPEDGIAPQEAQVAFKEKFRLESQIQQLELDLQKWQQEAQTAQALSVEMEQLQKSLAELEREKSAMEVQIGLLEVQAQEATTSCEENIRLVSEVRRLELELAECQSQKSLELSILLEAKTNLREEIYYLELQLNSCQQRGEESQTALAVMAKDNLKLREEIELLSIQAQEATALLAEKRKLEIDMVELELELKDSHRKKLAMRKEIKQLTLSLSEMECQDQCLASTVEMKTDFSVVEEENDALRHFVEKLEQDLKNCQQKLENTEIVHEELRRTIVSLHSELGQKVELELDTTTMAQSLYDKLKTNNVDLDMVVQRNFELETDLALKIGALEFLTEQLAEANIARQNTSRERDEMAAHVAALQATCALKNKQVQELQEEANKNSNELRTIIDNLESVSVDNRASVTHYHSMADSLGQELEEKKLAFLKLQEELHSARKELAQLIEEKENELCAAQENEENLQIELCMVKEELATAQRLAQENKRAADDAIQELEDRALAMSVLQDDKEKLQEKMEMLQEDLVHKTELVQGLESYLRQMQQRMVEDSDLQQEELLHANYQILELQAEVDQKTKEWTSLEEELMMTRITTVKVIHERDELRLHVKTSKEDVTISETEFPMRSEALSTMETEEQDDLKAQITSLERKVVFLESELQLKVEAMYLLKVELNAASLAAIDLTEESTGLKAHAADLEATKVALAAELKQNVDARCSLEAELRAARVNASSLMEQNLKLNTKVAKLQAKLIASEREIEQRVAEVSSLDSELAAEKWMANPHLTEESSVFHIESAKLENKSDPTKLLEDKLTSAMALKMTDESTNSEAQIAAMKSILKTKLQHRCQEIGTLEDQLKVARSTTSNIAEENGRLNAEVAELQSKIIASEVELEQKVAEIEIEMAATRLAMSHMDSELRAAKMTASNMTKENVGFNAQVAELQAKIVAKERELEHRIAAKVILEDELVAARFTASHMEGEFSAARMTAADMAEENDKLNAQIAELQVKLEQQVEAQVLLDKELVPARLAVSHMTDENSKLKLQIAELERKIQAMRLTELRIGALEEELKAKEEALDCLEKKHLVTVQQKEALLQNAEKKLIDVKSDKDRVSIELELLHKELMTLQSLPNCHETATVEAHKSAAVNERCIDEEEELQLLQTSVEMLQSTVSALENQLDLLKRESEQQQMIREDLELDLEGMRNHVAMLHAVRSTATWNAKSLQAAQSTNVELQRQLNEKDKDLEQLHKKLENECDDYTKQIEDIKTDLVHVQQELLALRTECEHKDKQINMLNVQLVEAETLTQDVMHDLHSVKLDISNYASLVSQQQLELISERARHSDEAQEKDEEVANLRAQLNKERESWMLEIHHKQAEVVVSRVLSEKLLLKNKTLANEYKKLKVDHARKRKQLHSLEEELKQLTEPQSCTESEGENFDEIKQFQALLACANNELAQNQA